MKLEWVILAEGLGQDSKGAVTAIGLNQNVLITPTVPASTKRAIMAHFVEDGDAVKTGDKMTFRVTFVSPSGKIINALTSPATLAPMPWSDLPISIDMPAEMVLACVEYGTYTINAEVELPTGETMSGNVKFYVREAPDKAVAPFIR
jgi:hypothetical protein